MPVNDQVRVAFERRAFLRGFMVTSAGLLVPRPVISVPAVVAPRIGFSPSGEKVWVLAGETAESVTLGPQPARIWQAAAVDWALAV
jgi:hypothetical protein